MGLEVTWGDAHATQRGFLSAHGVVADKERFTTRRADDRPRTRHAAAGGAHDQAGTSKDSPFDVYQVDPDGGALKTVNFLLTAQHLVAKSLALGAAGRSPTDRRQAAGGRAPFGRAWRFASRPGRR